MFDEAGRLAKNYEKGNQGAVSGSRQAGASSPISLAPTWTT